MAGQLLNAARFSRRMAWMAVSLLGLSACESGARQDPFLIHPSSNAQIMPAMGTSHVASAAADGIVSSPVAYQQPPTPSYEDRPLNENLAASLEVADYAHALDVTGLMAQLQRSGPFTVFAIPNAPLERYAKKWPGGLNMPAYEPQMRHLLAYTVVKGAWSQARLRGVMARRHITAIGLKTLAGQTITVSLEPSTGQLVLNNAAGQANRLWLTGIRQSNGILYITQGVLPPDGPA